MAEEFEFKGLTEFQEDLLKVATQTLPKETTKVMRDIGNRATTHVRREARAKVKRKTGKYYKKIKRGVVFKDNSGAIVTRVINSAPHAHLIEYGHDIVRGSKTIGYAPGKHIMQNGARNFESSGDFDRMLLEWLDDLLERGDL